jgi:hypothetical protein
VAALSGSPKEPPPTFGTGVPVLLGSDPGFRAVGAPIRDCP